MSDCGHPSDFCSGLMECAVPLPVSHNSDIESGVIGPQKHFAKVPCRLEINQESAPKIRHFQPDWGLALMLKRHLTSASTASAMTNMQGRATAQSAELTSAGGCQEVVLATDLNGW